MSHNSVVVTAIYGTATKTLRDMFISGEVTLGNDSGNLCCNGATELRDKMQEKLPYISELFYYLLLCHFF